jgi:hypothetical protein
MQNVMRTSRMSSETLFWTISHLAEEHLVFKFSSINPQIKRSEIVASMNVMKVTSGIISSKIIALRGLLQMVGLQFGMAMSDATGCN